jgi:hypothetical protein
MSNDIRLGVALEDRRAMALPMTERGWVGNFQAREPDMVDQSVSRLLNLPESTSTRKTEMVTNVLGMLNEMTDIRREQAFLKLIGEISAQLPRDSSAKLFVSDYLAIENRFANIVLLPEDYPTIGRSNARVDDMSATVSSRSSDILPSICTGDDPTGTIPIETENLLAVIDRIKSQPIRLTSPRVLQTDGAIDNRKP